MELDDWQKEILAYDGDLVLCTGRQVGKTTILARKSAEYMINHKGAKIICCSLTEDQAQLIIVMVLDFLEKNYKTYIAKGAKKPTKNKVELNNGSSIIARPVGNTGDAVRGFTGDVLILDEASRFAEFIFTASKPTLLTTGGKLWIASTPFGKQGYFYECFVNKSGRFKVFHISSEEVMMKRKISGEWTEIKRAKALQFLDDEKKDMSPSQYAQEYLGIFADDLRKFFPDELVKELCVLKRRESIDKERRHYLGVDIARMGNDESSFEIIQKISNKEFIHVESITTTKKLTTDTEERIIELHKLYKFREIDIDAGSGSLGVGVFDHLLKHPEVRSRLVAINNRSRSMDRNDKSKHRLLKEDLYQNLLSMMQRGEIKFLEDDEVVASFNSVQYEYVRKEGLPTKIRIFGNYTHIVEGIIRAAWAASQDKSLNIWVR